MSTRAPSYGQVDRDYGRQLATTPPDEDGPVWMVNLMKYHEIARYADESSTGTRGPVSGRVADDRYAPVEILTEIGAEVVLFGDVDAQLLGDHPVWDRVGVVRYPTRRSFIDMQSRPDFREKHVHKDAGMECTIVMGCQPADVALDHDLDADVDWKGVAHPPTGDDGPVVVVHVIRYADGGVDANMLAYQNRAANVAAPHGARVGGWYDVEGTIVGDGRAWDQVRFNIFPSKAAFMAVVFDPERMQAHGDHREPTIADTYTMIVRPTIYALGHADLVTGAIA